MEINSRTNPMHEAWNELFHLWGVSLNEANSKYDDWEVEDKRKDWSNLWGFLKGKASQKRIELDEELTRCENYRQSYLTVKRMLFPGE